MCTTAGRTDKPFAKPASSASALGGQLTGYYAHSRRRTLRSPETRGSRAGTSRGADGDRGDGAVGGNHGEQIEFDASGASSLLHTRSPSGLTVFAFSSSIVKYALCSIPAIFCQ